MSSSLEIVSILQTSFIRYGILKFYTVIYGNLFLCNLIVVCCFFTGCHGRNKLSTKKMWKGIFECSGLLFEFFVAIFIKSTVWIYPCYWHLWMLTELFHKVTHLIKTNQVKVSLEKMLLKCEIWNSYCLCKDAFKPQVN